MFTVIIPIVEKNIHFFKNIKFSRMNKDADLKMFEIVKML